MKWRKVGVLSKVIVKKYKLYEHLDKDILVYDDRIKHVKNRHLKEFKNVENIMYAYQNIPMIIASPDYVFLNKKNNSLEYYKKLKENFCVVVRINKGTVLKVKSWYLVTDNKIKNRKKQELDEMAIC